MDPEYWIGIMALVGSIIGYAVSKLTGWLDSGIGAALGILVGIMIYSRLKFKTKSKM